MRLDSVVDIITNSSSEAFMVPGNGSTEADLLAAMSVVLTDAVMAGDKESWAYLLPYLPDAVKAVVEPATHEDLLAQVTEAFSVPPRGSSTRDATLVDMGLYGKSAADMAAGVTARLEELISQGLKDAAAELSRKLGLGWRVGTGHASEDIQLGRLIAMGRDMVASASMEWAASELDITVAPFAISIHSGDSYLPEPVRGLLVGMGGVNTDE